MISVEVPDLSFIIGEIIIGMIASAVYPNFAKLLAGLSAIGFVVGMFVFGFSNPTFITDLNVVNDKIMYMMIALVNMLLHSMFFDIGATIVEGIRHPPRR